MTQEEKRLQESRARTTHWKRWSPYLSERAWGTVREDYSPNGTAWDYFPHDHARSKAYRWNEDGLGGISDRQQFICFALALWNGHDPILKERLFGLTGSEGNHGEDVKEHYFYLDSTPTHSYMKYLYKYPQAEFPYSRLLEENRRRGRGALEFELLDTGAFDADRYFDVFVEYAKATPEDILIRLQVVNRGPKDGINNYIVHGAQEAVNPRRAGTKAAAHYPLRMGPGETVTVRLRFTDRAMLSPQEPFGADFEQIFSQRQREADEFYTTVTPEGLPADARNVMRQALAGPDPLLRVFSWGQRRRHRRQPSDRLNWVGGEAALAEWRITISLESRVSQSRVKNNLILFRR